MLAHTHDKFENNRLFCYFCIAINMFLLVLFPHIENWKDIIPLSIQVGFHMVLSFSEETNMILEAHVGVRHRVMTFSYFIGTVFSFGVI